MRKHLNKRLLGLKIRTIKPSLQLALVLIIFLSLCLFENSQAYPYLAPENYLVLDDPRQAVAADFNGDGYNDLAVVNYRVNKVSILLNSGSGTFLSAVNYNSVDEGPNSIAAGDFDGDTDIDLAITNYSTDTIVILRNNGSGVFTFTAGDSYMTGVGLQGLTGIIAANLNHDSYSDLIVADNYNNTVGGHGDKISVLLNKGDGEGGTFWPAVNYDVMNGPLQIVSADFDRDLDNDLAVSGGGSLAILKNKGSGAFDAAVYISIMVDIITAGDFNSDGNIDLAGINENYITGAGSLRIIENNGSGTFTVHPHNPIGAFSTSIVAGNFDDITGIDLAISNYADNTITIFHGNNDFTVTAQPNIDTLPGPYDLATADFDNDTKLDLVSINKYENTASSGTYNTYSGNSISVYRSGVIITPVNGNVMVAEGGATDTYSVVLSSRPSSTVTITPATSDGQTTVLPLSLVFTTADWSTPQIVTVTAFDDALAEGPHTALITHTASSSDANYHAKGMPQISVNIADNDKAGVIINQSGGSTQGRTEVKEGTPADDSFSIVLETAPTANVDITLSHSTQIVLKDSLSNIITLPLTFTPADWNTPQTVKVEAPADTVIEGSVQEDIIFSSDSTDLLYDSLAINSISVNILDINILVNNPFCVGRTGDLNNDKFIDAIDGFYLSQMKNNTREPNDCAEVDMDGVISPGDSSILIQYFRTNFTSSSHYEIVIDESDSSTNVIEGGATDTYKIYLRQQPSDNVTINIFPDAQVTTNVSLLTFTPGNYFNAQNVYVYAFDDALAEGPHTGTITHTATSLDTHYDGIAAVFLVNGIATSDVIASIIDNDMAGITVSAITGDTTESGGTATFTVFLNTEPTADVTIGISSSDTAEGTVSPSSLTFTSADWSDAQTVTVTGVNDDFADGDIVYTIITAPAISTDPFYSLLNPDDVSVTNRDNDTVGFSVTNISGPTTEAGGTASFTIFLDTEPIADVTTDVSSSDITEGIVLPVSLTFTDLNWDTPQTVTVTGVNDNVVDGDISYIIETGIASSADPGYNGRKPDDVYVTNVDAGIVPVISPGGLSSIYTPADLTCEAVDLTVNGNIIKAINWNFIDNNTLEQGFRLYGEGLIRDIPTNDLTQIQIQEPDVTQNPIAGLLEVNKAYARFVRAYHNNTSESADSNTATCYTLANKPNKVDITKITTDSITIKLDPNDGNPPETKYAVRVISGTATNFVNPDGSFSPTENWYTYAEFGGANGVVVTGVTPATAAAADVQMVLTAGQNYSFSAKAKNGDNIQTAYSDENNSIPQAGIGPNITATKGVAVNLAWNSSFGLFSTAWAGDKFIINANEPLSRVLGVLAWLLNISLIILLVIFALSLQQSFKHLKQKFKYPETFKLIRLILIGEANDSYQKHAQQTEEGIFNKSSYHWHKTLHNLSQGTFIGAMALAGLKLMILGALLAGLVNLNHTSLAQNEPYNQSNTPVAEGDVLTYIIEVKSNLTATAQDAPISKATVSDILDSNLENFTVTGLDNCGGYTDNSTASDLNISGIDVAVGTTCFITFTADVKIGSAGNIITNQAQVSGSNFNLPTNETSNPVMAAAPINGNLNQPPTNGNLNQAPINDNLNQPPTNDNLNQAPTNGNINQPLPPTNDNQNVNQTPIVSPIEEQWPSIAIIGQIFSSIADIFENPEVEQASQNVVTPILIAIAAINILPAVLFSTLYLMPFLHLLFLEPLMILFGKKRKKWGIVYNSLTKLPVDLALVRLYNKETNQLVQTRVTDREGRYIMISKEPGKYYLSVIKPGFISPTNLLRDEKQDTKYIDLYHGEAIEVTEKDAVITANIPLDPAEKRSLAFSEVIRSYLLKNLRLIVSYVGIILALIVVLIIPTVITIGCLILHILFFLAFRRFIMPAKPKSWGIVYDAKTKEPLGSSVVRIFDLKFNKLLETQVTDRKGRYAFLVGKNQYQLLAEKPGYQNKEVKPVDLVKNEEIVNLDVNLDKI
jgi:hypothetical protein